jgi:hypothetical protein
LFSLTVGEEPVPEVLVLDCDPAEVAVDTLAADDWSPMPVVKDCPPLPKVSMGMNCETKLIPRPDGEKVAWLGGGGGGRGGCGGSGGLAAGLTVKMPLTYTML